MSTRRIIYAPVSIGDLIDRAVILEIKIERTANPEKQQNCRSEYALLQHIIEERGLCSQKRSVLKILNEKLWDLEDLVRKKEREQSFDDGFVAAARQIYLLNDQRSAVKREINQQFASALIEEKEHFCSETGTNRGRSAVL